jgi:hypothetical protein
LWTTAPDAWSFQAWAFQSILSPIAGLSSDIAVREIPRIQSILVGFHRRVQARANAILALATSNIMLLDHSLQSNTPFYARLQLSSHVL